MRSIDGRVTLRFQFAYLCDRYKHFDSRNQYEVCAFHWYLVHCSMNLAALDEGGQWLVEEHPLSLEVLGCPWSSVRVANIEIVETSRMGRKETLVIVCTYMYSASLKQKKFLVWITIRFKFIPRYILVDGITSIWIEIIRIPVVFTNVVHFRKR